MTTQQRKTLVSDFDIDYRDINDVINDLNNIKKENPQYDIIRIECSEYDTYIVGYRKETDEELDARLELENQAQSNRKNQRRTLYESLKVEFEK